MRPRRQLAHGRCSPDLAIGQILLGGDQLRLGLGHGLGLLARLVDGEPHSEQAHDHRVQIAAVLVAGGPDEIGLLLESRQPRARLAATDLRFERANSG